jgi:monothiol glutaredoxin
MAININELKNILNQEFTNSEVEIIDTVGDGNHLEATIVSDKFTNKNAIERHKMVYSLFGEIVGRELHALALKTITFAEKNNKISPNATNSSYTIKAIDPNDVILNNIHNLITSNDVVLFMKGSKEMPLCGFSSLATQILSTLNVTFIDIDVITEYAIREKIKEYSDWPTIPQLYIKGNFVGGADIIREMYESGELTSLLTSCNIAFQIPENQ